MAKVLGGELAGKALRSMGVEMAFFILGGPMQAVIKGCYDAGIRLIDVRHEGAAAVMAHAYSRVTGKTGVCITGAGCDTLNTTSGVADALLDCAPLVTLGGSAATFSQWSESFQEVDQISVMKPITKKAWQVLNAERIPEFIGDAFRHARADKPGPVHLDFPRDVLNAAVDEDSVKMPTPLDIGRPSGDERLVAKAIKMLEKAKRPVIIAGSGCIWSEASAELKKFVETTGIPFYTTPQSRGLVPEDHRLSFLGARAFAWKEADVILLVGTRTSMIIHHLVPPYVSENVKVIMVNIDAGEIGHNRPLDIGILGDAKAVLKQLTEEAHGRFAKGALSAWTKKLSKVHTDKMERQKGPLYSDEVPIHPLRLAREVRDFLPRDAILVLDGNEILGFGRQTIPGYLPRHYFTPGIGGHMGYGLPFAVGAKIARPETPVLALLGDGGFGQHGFEMDTAVRHKAPLVVVISNNGGWSGLPAVWPTGNRLGYVRYDKVVEGFGCWSTFVEKPKDIRPALEKAFAAGKPALVNVITCSARADVQIYSPPMPGSLATPGQRAPKH